VIISREQARDMAEAHAVGEHEFSHEGCPECEARPLSSYPVSVVTIRTDNYAGKEVVVFRVNGTVQGRMPWDSTGAITKLADFYRRSGSVVQDERL
jgi:hypothetical protein